MPDVAFVDGEFLPVGEARVSIDDRGFQYGDSAYEVIAAYHGRPFRLADHLARLRCSLTDIYIEFDPATYGFESIISEGLRRCGYEDAAIYIQVSRGTAPRMHVPPPGLTPTVVMTFRPLPRMPEKLRQQGAAVMTVPDIRWSKCYIKATTLLPNVLASMEAQRQGFDDAVFVAESGEVREGTRANLVAVRGGRLHFPTRDASILHGVTLQFLEELARVMGIRVHEAPLSLDELYAANEAFLSNTLYTILPVVRVNDRVIGDGRVGPVARGLFDAFERQYRRPPVVEGRCEGGVTGEASCVTRPTTLPPAAAAGIPALIPSVCR